MGPCVSKANPEAANAAKSALKKRNEGKINIILLGPPSCGKGTQGPKIKDKLSIKHISSGDLLRAAVKSGSAIGVEADTLMKKGELVPDSMIIKLMQAEIMNPANEKGLLFDGFPRTIEQANALDKILTDNGQKITKVVEFKIDDSLLVERVEGRRIHQPSGRSYHVTFNPPKVEGKDDETGEDLIQRADDNADALKTRLDNYHTQTTPISKHYDDQGVLFVIDASKNPEECWAEVEAGL